MQTRVVLVLLTMLSAGALAVSCVLNSTGVDVSPTARLSVEDATATAIVIDRGNRLTATAYIAANPYPTPVEPRPTEADSGRSARTQQFDQWAQEISIITLWFSVNFDATQQCVSQGIIDWEDYDHRVAALVNSLTSIAYDVEDGHLHSFTDADVEGVLSDANRLMREIDRKCGF